MGLGLGLGRGSHRRDALPALPPRGDAAPADAAAGGAAAGRRAGVVVELAEKPRLERRGVGERDGGDGEGEGGLQRRLVERGGLELAARVPLRQQARQRLVR